MALTPCEYCDCIPGNELKETWQQAVRVTLCAILEAVVNPPAPTPEDLVTIPGVSIAFGSITGSYTATTFLAAAPHTASYIKITNQTNADVYLSYSSPNTGFDIFLGAGQEVILDFGAENKLLTVTTDLYIKAVSDTPTLGQVIIQGYR